MERHVVHLDDQSLRAPQAMRSCRTMAQPAGGQLTQLLKEHISIAGEVVGAAKAKDSAKLQDADRRWHRNAEDIARFLCGANPNWQRSALVNMLNEHLSLRYSPRRALPARPQSCGSRAC
ncbi:MAG: hypothetical protein ACREK1_12965 [Longimicrobiales bacterium]